MPSKRIQRQIDRLLDQADKAIANRDWTAAGEHAQSVLRLNPDNSDVLAYLAAAKRDPGTSAAPNVMAQPAPAARPAESADNSPARLEQYIPKNCWSNWMGFAVQVPSPMNAVPSAKPNQAKEDKKAARTRQKWKN